MLTLLKCLLIMAVMKIGQCTIDGLSYMDPIQYSPPRPCPGKDPCNPLYWYPRNIPEHCYKKNIKVYYSPLPSDPPHPSPPLPTPPVSPPAFIPISNPHPILPIGFPIVSSNVMPFLPVSPQLGMVPGLPGVVTHDGGINILPFSDAYTDMLEEHKNKMMRRKVKRLLERFKNYPTFGDYSRLKQYSSIDDY